jgi:two-component system chemotaxis response regulator CheY
MVLKVMIVDDSMIMVQKLTILLRELGHQVVRVCRNGSEAVRDYPLVKPDLVTMDIAMPHMNGICSLKAIVAESAHARVIMVTSLGNEEMVIRAIDAGALGYVLKPVNKTQLSTMIKKAMKHNIDFCQEVTRDFH